MKNFLKSKLLIVAFFAIAFGLLISTNSFAYEVNTLNGDTVILNDEIHNQYEYYILFYFDTGTTRTYTVFYSDAPMLFSDTDIAYDNSVIYKLYYTGSNALNYTLTPRWSYEENCIFDGTDPQAYSYDDSSSHGNANGSYTSLDFANGYFYDANFPIRNKYTNELVFSPDSEGILSSSVKDIDFSTILSEILGLLPILLAVVISLLALRKAISFLMQTLRSA